MRRLLVVLGVLALLVAACDDDDDDNGDAGDDAQDTEEATDGDADLETFCQANVDINAALFSAEEPDPAVLEPLLATAEESAPDDIAEDVTVAAEGLREGLETQSDPTEDPAVGEAIGNIDEFVLDECGFEVVEVTGVDFAFEGIPDELEAGTTVFQLTNDAEEEFHELILFRINDGVDVSVDELLELPEEQVTTMVTEAGGTFAAPGDTGNAYVELEEGRYAAVCFIPVGTTEDEEGTGPPHFVEGMVAEFEVT